MTTIETANVSADAQAKAIDAMISALGADAVVTGGDDLEFFRDPYGYVGDMSICAAAVYPSSVEDVQAVLRIANQYRVPLWTSSTGRNNGYGGAAARVPGSIAVSLRRMNRVLEVNEELAYAIVEPGVSFFDFYEHLQAGGHKLLMSTADLGWGSVVGNTLDHGIGYTVYGDHASTQCGMEVVLANGDVLRTGFGAKTNSLAWAAHPRGYGPSPDGLFMQSNFGIVTKIGVWLMPRPERYKACTLMLKDKGDLSQCVDVLRPLIIDKTINGLTTIGNAFAVGAAATQRTMWYDGDGPMPLEAIDNMVQTLGIGHWNARIPFYGRKDVIEAQYAVFEEAIKQIPSAVVDTRTYTEDELNTEIPWPDQVPAGIPNNELLGLIKWRTSEGGGHAGFSPVCVATGAEAQRAMDIVESITRRHGVDISAGFAFYGRSAILLSTMLFDTANEAEVRQAQAACRSMVVEAGKAGFGEYRAHTDYMDLSADQFDFNDHAQRRFNELIKDTLDPNGILSPGKQGIWPRHLRDTQSPSARTSEVQ
jgi:4-cresol dehydrogenase (hydroxylating) flavoprotein subunit